MRRRRLFLLLLFTALFLSGCRLQVVETGSVRIAPTEELNNR